MIKNREDIRECILQIEKEYPVSEWKINDFHFWPVLRIRLFFYLIKKVETETPKVSKKQKNPFKATKKHRSWKAKPKHVLKSLYYKIWLLRLSKAKYLLVAGDGHRVWHQGKRFNRFFDVMVQEGEIGQDYLYFETDHLPKEQLYNPNKVINYTKGIRAFRSYKKIFGKQEAFPLKWNAPHYEEWCNLLDAKLGLGSFTNSYTPERLQRWYKESVTLKIDFFKRLLQKIKPTQIYMLCFYSEDNMMLLAAAHALNIQTIEMQHGPQSPLHLCYSYWTKLPKEGYAVLPRTYYCWDEESAKQINTWAQHHSLYKGIHYGHPWIRYWKQQDPSFAASGYVLYCLQPSPVTLSQLFPPNLISLIKELKLRWLMRLHPRQLGEKETIAAFFKEQGLWEYVEMEQATQSSLPVLLMNAQLHVTQFSGATIEAARLGVKTLLLHENGKTSFPGIIQKGMAIYRNPSDPDFGSTLRSLL